MVYLVYTYEILPVLSALLPAALNLSLRESKEGTRREEAKKGSKEAKKGRGEGRLSTLYIRMRFSLFSLLSFSFAVSC